MKPLYDELSLPISITITDRERIFREFGSPDSSRVHKPIDLCGSSGRITSTPGLLRISGRHNHLETTIAYSVDPLHPRFCPSSCAFPLPKADRCRHRIASKNLGPERQSSVQLMTAASIWRPEPTISRGIFSDSAA